MECPDIDEVSLTTCFPIQSGHRNVTGISHEMQQTQSDETAYHHVYSSSRHASGQLVPVQLQHTQQCGKLPCTSCLQRATWIITAQGALGPSAKLLMVEPRGHLRVNIIDVSTT